MDAIYEQLKKFGSVKANEPMKKHTTFKIGGPARFFVTVTETDHLVELLHWLDGEGMLYVIHGGGSNMLVHDEGFEGVVIHVATTTARVDGTLLQADAGCLTATTARLATEHGLVGYEWAVGVPGTVGGAVRGNAGAGGGEMKDHVVEVDVYSDGAVVTYTHAECNFGYRHSRFKETKEVVLRVRLGLKKGNKEESMKTLLAHIAYRTKTQPKGLASIGCIFKNYEITKGLDGIKVPVPQEFLTKGQLPAGWLVEQAGLKGKQVGGASVSPVHGNFVVNAGSASAQDVLTLVDEMKSQVYATCGVEIEEEIQVV
ncbi:MAG TPA: UDP-N-acetylmuramate dehydrogenase [Candidatus Kapabacteria bacterium]|nr:UDP-N-acetylmuramate dehydrogenase [Candidatus Kapabacteria bacterium]